MISRICTTEHRQYVTSRQITRTMLRALLFAQAHVLIFQWSCATSSAVLYLYSPKIASVCSQS